MDVKAKKHLGQHFLKDEEIAKDIADALTENGYENVLEIGPGMGVLTKYLLEKDTVLTVMELDRESVQYLQESFPLEHLSLNTSKEEKSAQEEMEEKGWNPDPFNGLKILKGEMDHYYDTDPEIQESELRIQYYKNVIDTLTEIISNVNWRHQTIGNMIKWKQFESGS